MTTQNLRRVPKTKGSRKVTMMTPRTRRRTKVNLTRKKAPVKTKRTEAVLRQAARRANHLKRMKKNGKELRRKKTKRWK